MFSQPIEIIFRDKYFSRYVDLFSGSRIVRLTIQIPNRVISCNAIVCTGLFLRLRDVGYIYTITYRSIHCVYSLIAVAITIRCCYAYWCKTACSRVFNDKKVGQMFSH